MAGILITILSCVKPIAFRKHRGCLQNFFFKFALTRLEFVKMVKHNIFMI